MNLRSLVTLAVAIGNQGNIRTVERYGQDGPNCFVVREGTGLQLHGCPFRFTGTNSYYQMIHRRGTDRPGANEVLDEMASRGMTVLRTWAFQDDAGRADCLQCAPARQLSASEAPSAFINEATFRGLDELLEKARTLKIRVILTLTNHWGDFGGMPRYVRWRFGSGVTGVHAFYTDPLIREWYRTYANVLVHRRNSINGRLYRDDPTIFAWELANEPRCPEPACQADDALNQWIAEMSCYVKSIDPNHLVTTGSEGFYGPSRASRNTDSWMAHEGQDFVDNHAHPCIDFATFHVWPQNWGWNPIGNTEAAMDRAAAYTVERTQTAQVELQKPVVLEEFGAPRDDQRRCPSLSGTSIRDRFYGMFYGLCVQDAQKDGACQGVLNWMIYDAASCSYDDGNGVFLPNDAATDAIITQYARELGTCPGRTPDEGDTACRLPGDIDFDCDVDQFDARRLVPCLSGPDVKPMEGCGFADSDGDLHVDLGDVSSLQRSFSGGCP